MLDYEWINQSSFMLSDHQEIVRNSEPNHSLFNSYTTQNFSNTDANFINPETHFTDVTTTSHHHLQQNVNSNNHLANFYEPTSMITLEPAGPTGFMAVPKTEPMVSRIGLNLGGRTYFASSEDDFANRLYRRPMILEPGSVNSPRCQAEGCNADLTHAKHYHRRHKVCEFHSKATTVIAAGLTQRFCQQCSRFHVLSQFDNGKRSCRRRLADHNRRRRKCHQSNQENGNA